MLSVLRSTLPTLALVTTLAACETDRLVGPIQAAPTAVIHSDDNAAVYWNGVARELVITTLASTPFAIRAYAVVSVAQYQAAIAAGKGRERSVHPSVHAAISAASVATLSYLFPAKADELEARLDVYLEATSRPGNEHVAAGGAVGRTAAEVIVERAKTDAFLAPWTGTVPVGAGLWYSSTNPPSAPGGAAFGQAKTFMLESGDQFRPAPPPTFGSAEFLAAVAEVRQHAETRTPEQDSIAKFWNLPVGTYGPPGFWNEEAANLALEYHLGEREAAHVLALTNIVIFDGLIASHEAKYHYWLLRPSQADPGIQLAIALPNFPSYPSNHATISAGAARILERTFPAEKLRLKALGEQAALSRVYGGIHYRFDGDVGIALGRTIADWVMAHDATGHRPLVLQ